MTLGVKLFASISRARADTHRVTRLLEDGHIFSNILHMPMLMKIS